jgi:hypothetical protein
MKSNDFAAAPQVKLKGNAIEESQKRRHLPEWRLFFSLRSF